MTQVNFHYPTIENRSVRLLNVRGSSARQSRLECNFLHGSLDDEHLRYEAISYCWADQTPTQLIRCEGEEALVTKNCEAALFRFRPCLENETRLLWIDSLCINQNDIQERNYQVGLMGEIYAKADQVLIWLGNESAGPLPHEPQYYIDAFDWMVRLADAAEYQDLGRRTQRLLQLMRELKSSNLLDFVDSVPWFKRLWVVQEAALSKKAVLVYNRATASLDALLKAKSTLEQLEQSGVSGANTTSNPLWNAFAVHHMAKKSLESSSSLQNPNNSAIGDFLGEARFSRTSGAKDKVFALYGLLATLGVPLPPTDYSKPTADIYREATAAVMQFSGSLRTLGQVDGLGATPHLASWVPDWASSKHSIGLLSDHYAALATPTPFLEFRDDAKKLVLKGCIIDIITAHCELPIAHTSERLGGPEEYLSWSKNRQPIDSFWKDTLEANPQHSKAILFLWNFRVLRDFMYFALDHDPAAASDESVLTLYYTLMSHCANQEVVLKDQVWARIWFSILSGQRVDPKDDVADPQWMSEVMRVIRNTPQLATTMMTPEYRAFERVSGSKICRTFHDRINRIRYKTVFRTASGKLGIAPYSIRTGDEIALFVGAPMPMVVRCSGAEYKVIAHAHVQGTGGGEAWPQEHSVVHEIMLV